MKKEEEKQTTLNAIELFNEGYEICVNETYEMMNNKNLLFAFVFYVCIILMVSICIVIAPSAKFTQSQIIEQKNPNTKELSLVIRYQKVKYYHRQITFNLHSNLNKKVISLVVSGSIRLLKKGRVVNEIPIEDRHYRIQPKATTKIFSTRQFEIDEISANLDLTVSDSQFNDLTIIWSQENSSWVLFVIFLRAISCLSALYLFFRLFIRIMTLKKTKPTYTQSFLMIMCGVFVFLWVPLPELRFFNIFSSLTPFFNLIESIDRAAIIYTMNVVCWNMVFRFTEREIPFLKRATFAAIVASAILVAPRAVSFKDSFYQDILEMWLPVVIMVLVTANLIRFPLFLQTGTPEFASSFLHIATQLPAAAANVVCVLLKADRNSKASVIAAALSTVALLMLCLLHWPRDDHGQDVQYVVAGGADAGGALQSDGDELGGVLGEIEINAEDL